MCTCILAECTPDTGNVVATDQLQVIHGDLQECLHEVLSAMCPLHHQVPQGAQAKECPLLGHMTTHVSHMTVHVCTSYMTLHTGHVTFHAGHMTYVTCCHDYTMTTSFAYSPPPCSTP